MNKRSGTLFFTESKAAVLSLIVCTAFFCSGVIIGYFTANASSVSDDPAVRGGIDVCLAALAEGTYIRADFFRVLLGNMLIPAAIMLLGMSVPGFVIIPVLTAFKGFSMSLAVSTLIRAAGKGKWLFSVGLFGISGLAGIVCVIFLAVWASFASFNLFKSAVRGQGKAGQSEYGRLYLVRCAVCFAAMLALSVLDAYVFPHLAVLLAKITV